MSSLFNEMMEEISEKDKKIADLEAKLAESENKIYELMTKLNMKEYAPVFCRLAGRECEELGTIDQLKQQLAEERKKVVQEIKKVLDNKASYSTDADDDWLIQIKESSLYELLDQIERGK